MRDPDVALECLRAVYGTRALAEMWAVSPHSIRRWSSVGVPRNRASQVLEAYEIFRESARTSRGVELGDDELEEYAEEWGVTPEEVEDLFAELDQIHDMGMPYVDATSYVDGLHEALSEEGIDLDVSDLWDMYYGYEPGGAK